MVNSEIVEIILRAVDNASGPVKQVDDSLNKFGSTAQQANQKMVNASKLSQQQMNNLSKDIKNVINSTEAIGKQGPTQFSKYNSGVQSSIVAFNRLDKETQDMLRYLSQMSDTGREAFLGMSSNARDAVSKFNEMKQATTGWNNTLDITKTKMQLTGVETDSLKGKIQVVGTAVTTHIGNKWSTIKPKVTELGNHIKNALSSALSTVGSKIKSLGDSFSGLGGIMSSVFGGIGLASMTQMTIGASVNRERIQTLAYSMLGYGESLEKFTEKGVGLWDKMDTLTNKSLVSLDQLAQSSAVVKQMTGATKEEMGALIPVINDIGQRAILMGKSGDEAMGLMQAAGKGLNGEFEMLRENFGITKEKLENLGWDGTAEDIKGYTEALQKALDESGNVNGLMDTASGKLTVLKKYWGLAGRSIGDDFLPYLNDALTGLVNFLDADKNGELDARGKKWLQYGYGVMAVGSGFATVAPGINSAITCFDNLLSITKSAGEMIRGVGSALGIMSSAEELAALATESNTIAQAEQALAESASGEAAAASAAGHLTAAGAEDVEAASAGAAAVSTWSLVWPVLALVAAFVAIAVVIYEVGKAFGWWDDVGGMIEAITSGVSRLWEAFINNPDVQDLLKGISDGFKWIVTSISPAIQGILEFLGVSTDGDFDIVHAIIVLVGNAFHMLADAVRSAIPYVQGAFNVLADFVGVAVGIGQGIYNALKPIVCILLGCSPGIVPALQQVQEVFMTVWNTIAGFISGVIETVVAAIQPIIDILTQITEFYLSAFIFAWQTLVMIFDTVIAAINRIIIIFNLFLGGQINLSTMLSMVWATISNMFATVLNIIITRVRTWALAIVARAIEAGKGFVNGIITFITNLPGKVASILANVLSRIISAGSQWVSNAKSKASSMVSGVISQVSQLPGKVYTEFMNIGSKMLSAGSQLVEKAKQIGKNIVDGILNAMQIHSPGIIQTKVVQEFEDMTTRVEDQIEPAGEVAKTFGETMVNQFGDVSLTPNLGYTDLDAKEMPEMNMNVGMDTSMVSDTNGMVTSSYDALAATTGAALQTMVEQDRLAYESIRNNDATQLSLINTDVQMKMNSIGSKVNTSINSMVNKNQSGLASARSTTQTQLTNITNATVKANNNMISSWNTMKDGIVSAANKIKSDSTKHFESLSSTIGTFYGKLKNPSRWGAGPGNGHVSGVTKKASSSASGVGRINRAIKKMGTKYLTLGQVKQNPLLDYPNFGDYIIRGDNNRYDLGQLVKYGALTIPIGIGAGGWEDTAPSHVSLIKNTSREWDMSSPNIGRYSTSAATFKVKEFENGAPQIAYDTFRQLAEEVFSQTQYEFYYDDDHHGNWLNAFNAASMNCKHGAEALIAMAGAMGLSGHMVHGHWNQYGHYWASIEGHKMDVTGWQNRRTWTPSASAGPAPKSASYSISDLFSELKTSIENQSKEPVTGNYDEILLGGSVTIVHEFLNLPPNIDEEEVARIVNETSDDESWIKKLVQNSRFQKWDLKEKARLNGRDARARGV